MIASDPPLAFSGVPLFMTLLIHLVYHFVSWWRERRVKHLQNDYDDEEKSFDKMHFQTGHRRSSLAAWSFCLSAALACAVVITFRYGDSNMNWAPVVGMSWMLCLDTIAVRLYNDVARLCRSRASTVVLTILSISLLVASQVIVAAIHPEVQHMNYEDTVLYQMMGTKPAGALCIGNERCDIKTSTPLAAVLHASGIIVLFLPLFESTIFSFSWMISYYYFYSSYGRESRLPDVNEMSLVCGTCVCVLVVKVQLDKLQSQLLSELNSRDHDVVKERVLRYQAEADADRQQVTKVPKTSHDDSVSMYTDRTSSTAAIMRRIRRPSNVEDALEDLRELGYYEHWLINDQALDVSSDDILGQGYMGVVRKGYHHAKVVAVKEAQAVKQNAIVSIANELRILRHVRHPNIAMFMGARIRPSQGCIDLVLEYVDGITMGDYVCRQKERCWHSLHRNVLNMSMMLSVAECLRYLHERTPCVVHGDLTPNNIMIVAQGGKRIDGDAAGGVATPQIKLLDFGLSRIMKGSVRPLGGTPEWAAPEVFCDNPNAASPAADIFSFGLLIYFMMTGAKPQVVRTGQGTFDRLRLKWPRHTYAKLTKAVVYGMLVQDPNQRLDAERAHAEVRQAVETLKAMPDRRCSKRFSLAVPHLLETPSATIWQLLLDLVLSVNVTVPSKACCSYHAAMAELTSQLNGLNQSPCHSVDFDSEIIKSCRQCTTCLSLRVPHFELVNPMRRSASCCRVFSGQADMPVDSLIEL